MPVSRRQPEAAAGEGSMSQKTLLTKSSFTDMPLSPSAAREGTGTLVKQKAAARGINVHRQAMIRQ